MYAIFRTAGKQFRAEVGRKLQIPTLAGAEPGAKLSFDEVSQPLGLHPSGEAIGPTSFSERFAGLAARTARYSRFSIGNSTSRRPRRRHPRVICG